MANTLRGYAGWNIDVWVQNSGVDEYWTSHSVTSTFLLIRMLQPGLIFHGLRPASTLNPQYYSLKSAAASLATDIDLTWLNIPYHR